MVSPCPETQLIAYNQITAQPLIIYISVRLFWLVLGVFSYLGYFFFPALVLLSLCLISSFSFHFVYFAFIFILYFAVYSIPGIVLVRLLVLFPILLFSVFRLLAY